MTTDHFRYDILAQEALRGVIRTVLADVSKNRLLGEHHFKISFDTNAPGVRLSARLRQQYPAEMTIILQHQFWDLTVGEDAFEVGLSFGGVPERLRVPFDAVIVFFDPSVNFRLEFAKTAENEEDVESSAPSQDTAPKPRRPAERKQAPEVSKPSAKLPAAPESSGKDANSTEAKPQENAPPKPPGGAEVVRLDRFRKK